ncbi:MAG: hypothetical protein E6H74_11995 [Betaproteobacteria bacterium]|nr:MAG: hypothetical protein E6H74_11995 [Betaproteobacteria bacterium]
MVRPRHPEHTGEIDTVKPLDALWVFGKPAYALDGFAQARIAVSDGRANVAAAPEVSVEIFGDAPDVQVVSLG